MSRDSIGPVRLYLPETYLELLQLEGGFLISQRKDKAKSFTAEKFPALQTTVPYPSSRVAEISAPIGPHGPPQNNSLEYISPTFF